MLISQNKCVSVCCDIRITANTIAIYLKQRNNAKYIRIYLFGSIVNIHGQVVRYAGRYHRVMDSRKAVRIRLNVDAPEETVSPMIMD